MNGLEHVARFVDRLRALDIPFMVTGSLASNMYGIPRATQDADLVVELHGDALAKLAETASPAFKLDPQGSFESVTMTTRYVFRSKDHELKIELFLLSDDPHDQERFVRRRKGDLGGSPVDVPTPEDVLVAKLRWLRHANRTKDREDIRNVLAVQGDSLDWDYIRRWCSVHGTLELLEQIRESIPDLPSD